MGLGKVKISRWSLITIYKSSSCHHHSPLTTHHSPAPAEQAILRSHHVQKALSEGHCTFKSSKNWEIGCFMVQTHTSMMPSNLSSSFSSVFRNSAASAFEADVASWRNIWRVSVDEIQRSTKKGASSSLDICIFSSNKPVTVTMIFIRDHLMHRSIPCSHFQPGLANR